MFNDILTLLKYNEISVADYYRKKKSWFIFVLRYCYLAVIFSLLLLTPLLFNGQTHHIIFLMVVFSLILSGLALYRCWCLWRFDEIMFNEKIIQSKSRFRSILEHTQQSPKYLLSLAATIWGLLSGLSLLILFLFLITSQSGMNNFGGISLYYLILWFINIALSLFLYFSQAKDSYLNKAVNPILTFLVSFIILILSKYFHGFSPGFSFNLALCLGFFFTRPLISKLTKDDSLEIPFGFTLFTFVLFLFFLLIARLKIIPELIGLLSPNKLFSNQVSLFNSLNKTMESLNHISEQWFFPLLIIPGFFGLLFICRILFEGIIWTRERYSKADDNESRNFLSLHPVFFIIIKTAVIYTLLFFCIPSLAGFFSWLFQTFRIAEIFNITFLNYDNFLILGFAIISIFLLFDIYRILNLIITSITGYLSITQEEIIYYAPQLLKKDIIRIPITHIHCVSLHQPYIQNLFCYGSLIIKSSDTNKSIEIPNLSFPERIQNKIIQSVSLKYGRI